LVTERGTVYRVHGFAVFRVQWRILLALMLRDVRTRFFNSAWGFLVAIAWPLSHILLLLLIYFYLGRAAPYGDSVALWFATGIVPYICFSYMSRFIMMGVIVNKSLLSYPVLKFTDIVFAKAIVEILSAGLVIIILICIFWAFDIDFMPIDPIEASYALFASALLGLGIGIVSAIIATLVPLWAVAFNLAQILLWMLSGVIFVPDALPEQAKVILAYNPLLQCVEWLRSSYYEGYGTGIIDKPYVLLWGVVSLFLGLGIERLIRGQLLMGNG
jgi:capsular polysaccharide transport system permease protein